MPSLLTIYLKVLFSFNIKFFSGFQFDNFCLHILFYFGYELLCACCFITIYRFYTFIPLTGMPIFCKFTEFRKSNLLRMSSVNLNVFRKFPEFRQSQYWGIFLQKTYKNAQADCESRLPAYRRA